MAATERRAGSSRRGMTVLGKVPVVPKPINLPSQRLENRGLSSDVDIVPRGTCSWGSAGQFHGANGNKPKKSDSAYSNPLSNGGEHENGGKVESKPVSSIGSKNSGVKDEGGLLETSVQFSSPKATTVQALDCKGKIEELRSYTHNALGSRKQETTETFLQKGGDGYVGGVSVPPGFGHCGPEVNHSRAGVSTSNPQCNGVGSGMYPNNSQQNGFYSFPGVPSHNGKKEREIIVIHMVGSPGLYGNYVPQLGYPDNYNRNGLYGNFPLQFGNFEPYFGFQGHGRLDGGAQISAVTGSDLFDEHEDYVCYEKECYHGRRKNGFVRGGFQESTFLGGGQRDVHEALMSRSSLKSRSTSQKHSPRNVGRLKSLYHDGRFVPIEEASAVPVPEKRITLLTKVSQHKLLTIKSIEETGIGEAAHAEDVVGSVFSACGDEGKAPETFEANIVIEDAQVNKTGASASLKMGDEVSLCNETELVSNEVSLLTTTCNDMCLHCKAGAAVLEGPPLMICQACKKASVCEGMSSASQCLLRPTEELPVESIDKSNSIDGCAVEVKHVIFDADSCSLSTVKGQEDASLSSSTEAADADKQLDTQSSLTLKALIQNNEEGKGKQRLLGKKGTDGKWKPKRPAGAAKMDFKVFAPKIRKAAGRKNTSKTFANECASEASSSAMYNNKDSMVNMGADSIRLSNQTETCNRCQEPLSPASLSSSMDVPDDDSCECAKEKLNGATYIDCIASQGHVQKKKGKNTHKTTLHKDCHDNAITVHRRGSLVKTEFEDVSSTDLQKEEPKGASSTNEKAWRPKVPAVLPSKSATKASGIRVGKAHVVPRKLGLQGSRSHLVFGSTFSAESSEEVNEEGNTVQKSSSPSTFQPCNSEVLKANKSQSFKAPPKNSARGQQRLVFRKRSAEQAALGHQSSRDTSSNKQPIGSLAASSKGKFGPEHTNQSLDSAQSNLEDVDISVSASKYHMIRRRVYHVVEGSGGDYFVPFTSQSGKLHQTGNHRSLPTTSSRNQKQFQKNTVFLSSGSSYTESEHSEEYPDSMFMGETKSCRFENIGVRHSEQAGITANQHTSGSLLSSSGFEESKAKKHVRPGECFSAWKPKAAPGTSISTHVEGASKETNDSASSSQVSSSSYLHAGENNDEHTIENLGGLPSELEGVCHQPGEEINHSLNQEDALLSIENKDVVDSQKSSEIVVSMEEMEQCSVLKHVEEVPPSESLSPVRSFKEELVQQATQTSSQENTDVNCRPFFKKKNVMSYEKANRYHQMMFKKYKQTGHWKPKAGLHSKVLVESERASQNCTETPMKVVLMVA